MSNKGTFRIFLLAESKWQRTPLSSSPKHKLGKTSWKINAKSQQSVTIKKHEVLNHSFSCCSSKPRPLITSENTDWLSSFCLIGISVPKCSHGREIKAWQLRLKKKSFNWNSFICIPKSWGRLTGRHPKPPKPKVLPNIFRLGNQ